MNATQLANVLQKVKADPVLQETLRVTKQDWVELNLTTQEILQASMNIASYPEFSDSEIEYMYANKWTAFICSLLSNCNCTRDTDCQEYCGQAFDHINTAHQLTMC